MVGSYGGFFFREVGWGEIFLCGMVFCYGFFYFGILFVRFLNCIFELMDGNKRIVMYVIRLVGSYSCYECNYEGIEQI
jgi:hypothetical protein